MTYQEWKESVEYLATRIERKFGRGVLTSALAKYGARTPEDLCPAYYEAIVDDLLLIDEDG